MRDTHAIEIIVRGANRMWYYGERKKGWDAYDTMEKFQFGFFYSFRNGFGVESMWENYAKNVTIYGNL